MGLYSYQTPASLVGMVCTSLFNALTRQIFDRRYVCGVAGTAGYQVDWLDEGTNPARTIHVEDSKDIRVVPTELPSMGPR